jgi:hypothetical protein
MPLLTGALAAGKAAFSLIPKNKEARKKAAQSLKTGFQWVKKQAGKLATFEQTPTGYKVTGKTFDYKAPTFSGGEEEKQMDWAKIAPWVIGGLILLNMKK